MPIYEFDCPACRKKVDILVRLSSGKLRCPNCGNLNLTRRISRFAIAKTVKSVHEESGEPGAGRGLDYYKDPRNIGRWTEKKFEELGMDMPARIRENIDAAREGVLPEPLSDLSSPTTDASFH